MCAHAQAMMPSFVLPQMRLEVRILVPGVYMGGEGKGVGK